MKKYLTIIIAAVLFASCKKETSNSNTIDNLFTETKDNVQRNEPVLLSFGDNTTAQAVSWKSEPNTDVTLNNVGAYTTATFANAGSYTVTALNGKKQATFIVNVINTLYNEFGSNFSLSASKIVNVNINEDVVFTVHNPARSINQLDWSYVGLPSTVKGYNANNTAVTISYQNAGAKYVTITDGTHTETRTIWVNDVPTTDKINTAFIFGDKLNITPSIENTSGNKNLVFTTNSTYNYQCNTDKIIADAYAKNNNYLLSFGGVTMSATACSNITKANVANSFSNIQVGNYPFNINYQNKTFTGTINVDSSGTYTIGFADNNFINFTTKTAK